MVERHGVIESNTIRAHRLKEDRVIRPDGQIALLYDRFTSPAASGSPARHAFGKSIEEWLYMGTMEYSVKELSEAWEATKFPMA